MTDKTAKRMADHRETYGKNRRKPTDQQQAFLDNFVNYSQDFGYENYREMVLKAYGDAGYDAANANAYYRAKEVLKNNWNAVEQRLSIKLSNGALFAADTLINLAINAKQESTRLKAAVELLNKAGFKEADRIEVTEKPADQMTYEERQKEIQRLMANGGLKVVGGDCGSSEDTEEV